MANQFLKTQILLFLSNLVGRDEMACKDETYDLSKLRLKIEMSHTKNMILTFTQFCCWHHAIEYLFVHVLKFTFFYNFCVFWWGDWVKFLKGSSHKIIDLKRKNRSKRTSFLCFQSFWLPIILLFQAIKFYWLYFCHMLQVDG